VLAVEPVIIDKYVRQGQVKLVFRALLNLGEGSVRASEAAACAGLQGRFWQMHQLLFQRQRQIPRGDALVAGLQQFATALPGLDQAAFATCLKERMTLQHVQATDAEQRERGIRSQPTFEISGPGGMERLVGLPSVEALSAALDKARG
jgi:protein-disulfide isomerase